MPSLAVGWGEPAGFGVALTGPAGDGFGDDRAQFAEGVLAGDAAPVAVIAQGAGGDDYRVGEGQAAGVVGGEVYLQVGHGAFP